MRTTQQEEGVLSGRQANAQHSTSPSGAEGGRTGCGEGRIGPRKGMDTAAASAAKSWTPFLAGRADRPPRLCTGLNRGIKPRRPIATNCGLPRKRKQIPSSPKETSSGIPAGSGTSSCHFCAAGALEASGVRTGLPINFLPSVNGIRWLGSPFYAEDSWKVPGYFRGWDVRGIIGGEMFCGRKDYAVKMTCTWTHFSIHSSPTHSSTSTQEIQWLLVAGSVVWRRVKVWLGGSTSGRWRAEQGWDWPTSWWDWPKRPSPYPILPPGSRSPTWDFLDIH